MTSERAAAPMSTSERGSGGGQERVRRGSRAGVVNNHSSPHTCRRFLSIDTVTVVLRSPASHAVKAVKALLDSACVD
eukprot:1997716-Pyramimonas_sp.AAC.1